MKKLKKIVLFVYFQIGVNVVGLPDFHVHDLTWFPTPKSKYIK